MCHTYQRACSGAVSGAVSAPTLYAPYARLLLEVADKLTVAGVMLDSSICR